MWLGEATVGCAWDAGCWGWGCWKRLGEREAVGGNLGEHVIWEALGVGGAGRQGLVAAGVGVVARAAELSPGRQRVLRVGPTWDGRLDQQCAKPQLPSQDPP